MKSEHRKRALEKAIDVADRIIGALTVLFFVLLIFLGGYALLDSYLVYNSGNLPDDIAAMAPDKLKSYTLTNLQEINPDIVAWVRVDGTHMNYPVVRGKDNTEYLNRDYRKEHATAGSVFLDYRNDRMFDDKYSIIYGHNMRADLMFSDIKRFENKQFFATHRTGTLWVEGRVYGMEIVYYAKFNAFSNDVYNLITYRNDNTAQLIEEFKEGAVNVRDGDGLTVDDKILLLSTCNTMGSNDRAVLVARLVLESGDEMVGSEKDLERLEREKEVLKRKDGRLEEAVEMAPEDKHWMVNGIIRQAILVALSILVIAIFTVLGVKQFRLAVGRKHKAEKVEKTEKTKKTEKIDQERQKTTKKKS